MRWWDKIPKKLAALALGLLVQALPLPEDIKKHATELLMVYLGAQGVADMGKERAKVEADAVTIKVSGDGR
jgi:hypothetical protein